MGNRSESAMRIDEFNRTFTVADKDRAEAAFMDFATGTGLREPGGEREWQLWSAFMYGWFRGQQ